MFDLFRSIYDFGFQLLSETSIELSEENKKSEPISYRKQVRIIFVWSEWRDSNSRELLARIHAVLRRRPSPEAPGAPSSESEVLVFGPFTFDLGARLLRRNGEELPLTTGEFAMLKALARHPRQPLSREKLAQLARGREFEPFDRSLDVQVSRLRKLIEQDPAAPRYIQTVWGVGYVFVPDGAG